MNRVKKVYIYQYRYLGDVIFVMAIAQKYLFAGHTVIFPIEDSYIATASIQKNFPGINFIPFSLFNKFECPGRPGIYEDKEKIIINLLGTGTYNQHMGQKYRQLNLPVEYWRNLKIERDSISENKLLAILNINKNEKFNLINEYYSNKKTVQLIPAVKNNYRNIYLKKIDGFNLFDWMGVIEKASTIHTVHTSIQYIIDTMPNVTDDLHIYPRSEIFEPHSYYDYLFAKNYCYHPHPKNILYVFNFKIRLAKRFIQNKIGPH
jgi:hypothetical protein